MTIKPFHADLKELTATEGLITGNVSGRQEAYTVLLNLHSHLPSGQ